MSFSRKIKEELSKHVPNARHCGIAEMAAAFALSGEIDENEGFFALKIYTETESAARKYFTLLKKTFNINTEISKWKTEYPRKVDAFLLYIDSDNGAEELLKTLKLLDQDGHLLPREHLVNGMLVQRSCCKRAFIRGAFMAAGSISDPEKSYHFEISCHHERQAEEMVELMSAFDVEAKVVARKHSYVVYIKESSQIVEILNVMEAHVGLMEFENIRIIKDMRNSLNRKVNCETANSQKTATAAVKQLEDIQLIAEKMGLDELPDGLREVAELRLENPEISLKELGSMLNPPVGKSGVNHRFRKLGELADDFRTGR